MSKNAVQKSADQEKLLSVMKRTEKLLIEEPATRNDDKLLIVRYLNKYHHVNDIHEILFKDDIPSFESIRRSRQHIQAQGRCKPIEMIAEARAENQLAFWRFFANRRKRKPV